jgi:hypothetical protein
VNYFPSCCSTLLIVWSRHQGRPSRACADVDRIARARRGPNETHIALMAPSVLNSHFFEERVSEHGRQEDLQQVRFHSLTTCRPLCRRGRGQSQGCGPQVQQAARAKAKGKAPASKKAPAAKSAAPAATTASKTTSKAAFVRAHASLSPKEIIAKAKAQGIKLGVSYVYNVRGADKMAAKKKRGGKLSAAVATSPALQGHGPSSSVEALLKAVGAELGLAVAIALLHEERARVRAAIGG